MSLGPGWRRAFRLPFSRPRTIEREVDDELAFHLAMREEKLRRSGMTPESARAEAASRFGNPTTVRDECITIDQQYAREVRVMEWIESVWSDARYAVRTMRRAPVFTAVIIITLALGIGATSAMFSLVDGILLRPLPYPEPDRLVWFKQSFPEKGLDDWTLSQENAAMYRDRATDFSSFAAIASRGVTLGGERPEQLNAELTTGQFFKVLGVSPLIGRAYTDEEDTPRKNTVAVLSYGLWQTHFGGDRRVLGKTIDVNGSPITVIGVMPADFTFPHADIQLWIPLGLDPNRRFGWFLSGVARLKPGATVEQAHRQTTTIFREWARQAPGLLPPNMAPEHTGLTTLVTPLRERLTRDVERPLLILQAAVLLILLIAVANVATLQSSRAASRSREVALRNALGATSGRVARQLLTESFALALIGAGVGVTAAALGVRAFTHSDAIALPRINEVGLDGRVLAFTLGVAVFAGVLFGLAPVLHTMRSRLTGDLSAGQRETSHRSTRRLNSALIVAQITLSVTLLISAGLVLKSFRRLLQTDLGFEPRGAMVIGLPLPRQKYMNNSAAVPIIDATLAELRSIPDIRSAAVATTVPFSADVNSDGYLIEGHAPPSATGSETQVVTTSVTPGYFHTMGIRLVRGRDFTAADREDVLPVTIVDEALARRYWPDGDGVGKRMRLTGDTTWLTIVGVSESVRDEDAAKEAEPHMYVPMAQSPSSHPVLILRTSGNSAAAVAAARRVIHRLEPGVPLDNVRPLADYLGRALATRRLTEILLGAFALMAVTLAAVGIYGVMSLYVANRTHEFGIRMAVGAEPAAVMRLVMWEGTALAIAGIIIGVGGAMLATRWLGSLLYDVSAHDPLVFVSLPLGLLAVAAASCYVPARRAARSDPLRALRAE
jgi:predicted permease